MDVHVLALYSIDQWSTQAFIWHDAECVLSLFVGSCLIIRTDLPGSGLQAHVASRMQWSLALRDLCSASMLVSRRYRLKPLLIRFSDTVYGPEPEKPQ